MPDWKEPAHEEQPDDVLGKPYPNEHAARIKQPGLFVRIRQLWTAEGGSIRGIGGPLKSKPGGGTVTQAVRFKRTSWTVAAAKKWLKDHDYKVMMFEPATGKAAGAAGDNLPADGADISENRAEGALAEETKTVAVATKPAPIDKRLQGIQRKELVAAGIVVGKDEGDDAGSGWITGYLSEFGKKDLQNEIVKKGAFTKTLKELKTKLPFMIKHLGAGGDLLECVGAFTKLEEDSYGLAFRADYLIDEASQKARHKIAAVRGAGIEVGTSIGYMPVKNHYDEKGGEDVGQHGVHLRTLIHDEVKLLEGTATLRPANVGASITDGKTDDAEKTIPALQAELSEVDESLALDARSRLVSALGGDEAVTELASTLEELAGKARLLVRPAADGEPQDVDADAEGTAAAEAAALAEAEAEKHSSESKATDRKRIAAAAKAKAALYS